LGQNKSSIRVRWTAYVPIMIKKVKADESPDDDELALVSLGGAVVVVVSELGNTLIEPDKPSGP
jgi:hypothetical protein